MDELLAPWCIGAATATRELQEFPANYHQSNAEHQRNGSGYPIGRFWRAVRDGRTVPPAHETDAADGKGMDAEVQATSSQYQREQAADTCRGRISKSLRLAINLLQGR